MTDRVASLRSPSRWTAPIGPPRSLLQIVERFNRPHKELYTYFPPGQKTVPGRAGRGHAAGMARRCPPAARPSGDAAVKPHDSQQFVKNIWVKKIFTCASLEHLCR